jgi:hypothetical protein
MIEQTSARTIGLALVATLMLPLFSSHVLADANTIDAAATTSMVEEDRFGTKEIYQTANAGEEWYVNMNNPSDDQNFRNIEEIKFTKQSDGSWQAGGKENMRLEAWSPTGGWKNVEITAHFKVEKARADADSKPIIQLYARGGHHTMEDQCLGSAYKARLYMDGHTTFVKEVNHPAYTDERGAAKVTSAPLELGKWYGFKAVIYNIDNDSAVHMESWVDEDDSGNWKLASAVDDNGGWSVNAANMHDFDSSCGKAKDEVITKPGVLVAFRTDGGTVWDFKDLSAREIQTSTTPTSAEQPSSNSTTTSEDNSSNSDTHEQGNNNSIGEDDQRQYMDRIEQCFDNTDSNNNDELKKCLSDAIDQLFAHSDDQDHSNNQASSNDGTNSE